MKQFYRTLRLKYSSAAAAAAAAVLLAAISFSAGSSPETAVNAPAAPEDKVVYLTFDDGPTAVTEEILEVLDDYDVPATFFVIGCTDQKYHHLITEAAEEGHAIGAHTFSHEYSQIYASEEAFWAETEQCASLIEALTDRRPTLLRFPGGSGNTVFRSKGAGGDLMKRLSEGCADRGYSYHDWNVDTEDNLGRTLSAETIAEKVVSGCKDKSRAVVLMHDAATASTGPAALRIAIPQLLSMGFRFETLENIENPVHQTIRG